MIIYFIISLIIIAILLVVFSIMLNIKLDNENAIKTKQAIIEPLELNGFFAHETIVINKTLTLAVNKEYTKLAIVENFNPDYPDSFYYEEIATCFINKIEKNNFNIKITYTKKGDKNCLYVSPVKKESIDFFYKIYKKENLRKIEIKYPSSKFAFSSSSDWNCNYVWAYSPDTTEFAYVTSIDKPQFRMINLRKKHFIIDTKYNYLELPFTKQRQQIMIYDPQFLDQIFQNLLKTIKQKTAVIKENCLYYDHYTNTVYLTNNYSSIQSLILDEVEEIYYKDTSLYITLIDNEQSMSYQGSHEIIQEFEEFITNYNLRKIANNFDYKSDRLINATNNTKFIIDITRDRIVYCANLNKIRGFNYLTISFANLEDAKLEKYGNKSFVRIFIKDADALDVSCTKPEVAHYILGQIKTIIES